MLTVAVVAWAIGAMALIALGLIGFTSGSDLRQAYLDQGMSSDSANSYVSFVRTLSVVLALLGLVIAALLGAVRDGGRVARRIVVGVSGLFAAVSFVSLAAGAVPVPPLIVVALIVLLVVASVLSYRPAAGAWFARART